MPLSYLWSENGQILMIGVVSMPRRGESIYRRKDGRWEGRYIKSRTTAGKPVFGFVYGVSYKAVKAKLLPLKMEYRTPVKGCYSGTFGGWLRGWMEEQSNKIQTGKVKQSTLHTGTQKEGSSGTQYPVLSCRMILRLKI